MPSALPDMVVKDMACVCVASAAWLSASNVYREGLGLRYSGALEVNKYGRA